MIIHWAGLGWVSLVVGKSLLVMAVDGTEVVDVSVLIYLRMKGQGHGPVFRGRISYLEGLAAESVRAIKLVVVGDDDLGAIGWACLTRLLNAWRWVTGINILDWPRLAVHDIESLVWIRTCPYLHIVNHKGNILDLSQATVPQKVDIQACHALILLGVGALTTEVYVEDAPCFTNLGTVTDTGTGTPGASSLLKMTLKRCPALELDSLQAFSKMSELTIRNSRFMPSDIIISPIHAFRATLKSLIFWNNVCTPQLELTHFQSLKHVSVGACSDLRNLVLRHCPRLERVTVRECPSFISLLPSLSDLPALRTVMFVDCPELRRLRIRALPLLQEVEIARTGLDLVSIMGTTCPQLESIKIRGNPKLLDGACLLHGSFLHMEVLQLDGNGFAGMPVTQVMPALRLLNLDGNPLQDPVELLSFPALESISVQDVDVDVGRATATATATATPLRLLVNPLATPMLAGTDVVIVVDDEERQTEDVRSPVLRERESCACCNPLPDAFP